MSSWFGSTVKGMPLISCTILRGRLKEILSILAKKLLIDSLFFPSAKGPSILFLRGSDGSQKSSHTHTLSPLAMDHFKPLLKTIPPTLQAFQMQEAV